MRATPTWAALATVDSAVAVVELTDELALALRGVSFKIGLKSWRQTYGIGAEGDVLLGSALDLLLRGHGDECDRG